MILASGELEHLLQNSEIFIPSTETNSGNPMQAQLLNKVMPVEKGPLELVEINDPVSNEGEVLLRVKTCGICHTDLHIMEGEIDAELPVVPGHQVVGEVIETGKGVSKDRIGERVGVPWLNRTCGHCRFCRSGMENLCEDIRFTGFHSKGGLAEFMTVDADFMYPIPEEFSDVQAAPLLCGGIIGYRALNISGIRKGGTLGLFGFGASAHIAIQVAIHWGARVYVFTRSMEHRLLADKLGAEWVGGAEDQSPSELDSSIIFAPAGSLIPHALEKTRKGGTVALAGIYMDRVPEMSYDLIYGERKLVSIANSTREDCRGLLREAAEIPIMTEVETFRLEEANQAYLRLKRSEINGAGVVVVSDY